MVPEVKSWMDRLLSNRTCKSDIFTITVVRTTSRDIPQGGVMSPLLWNLVLEEILNSLRGLGVKIVAYAEDIVMMETGITD